VRICVLTALFFLSRIAAAESCSAEFLEFVGQFEASPQFQAAHTRFPLSYSYVDGDASPEPKILRIAIERERAAEFPGIVYPSPAQQAAVAFDRTIDSPQPDTRAVRLEKPDTDYVLVFTFEKSDVCWNLVSVQDLSL
jgi:hypothetical protein